MFANYNYEKFPIINVSLGSINNDNDFKEFTDKWLELYDRKTKFSFIFDTSRVGYIHPKYSIYMAIFIKLLKKKPIQYLESSTIYVYNNFIYNLLKLIFNIEKPVAPVTIIYNCKEKNITNEYKIYP
jgi:hypothetical protein|tara:strand:+ start:1931 stop:2311 length:381 start_codon:yes stop_codon:yes gene_type:complete